MRRKKFFNIRLEQLTQSPATHNDPSFYTIRINVIELKRGYIKDKDMIKNYIQRQGKPT